MTDVLDEYGRLTSGSPSATVPAMLSDAAGARPSSTMSPPADGGAPPSANVAFEDPLATATILLDCRWLGSGGAGRVTEMLLDELRRLRPNGTWRLWGDPKRLSAHLFPGASIAPENGHPTRWFGQAAVLRVPANNVAVYLHQVRPLCPGSSITFVLDTIPIRFARGRLERAAKRVFLRVACMLSARIITISDWSRDSIVRDLGVPPSKLIVTVLAVDPVRIARIRALRASLPRADYILFIGRFAEHKNLPRLCRAFQLTAFHRDGGRLVLVGGSRAEVKDLSAFADREGLTRVDVRGPCTEADLDRLLATCRALVQPSLEEGFGLPAVEAAAVGVQVAATRTGCAPEIPTEQIAFMDPLDEDSMASAIDDVVGRPDSAAIRMASSTLAQDVIATLREVITANAASVRSGGRRLG